MGLSQIALIVVLGLILFSPDDYPKIAKTLGNLYSEILKVKDEVMREFEIALKENPDSYQPQKDSILIEDKKVEETPSYTADNILPLIDDICSNARGSAISYDAIVNSQAFKGIVKLENDALSVILNRFEKTESDGLREYVMAMAASTILEQNSDFNSGREWFIQYNEKEKLKAV